MQLFFVSSIMIIHFGKNPVRGGNPPSDSRIISVVEIINGDLFHIFVSEAIEVESLI